LEVGGLTFFFGAAAGRIIFMLSLSRSLCASSNDVIGTTISTEQQLIHTPYYTPYLTTRHASIAGYCMPRKDWSRKIDGRMMNAGERLIQ
jgi:hypothetical protein